MKKNYISPEINTTLLTNADILNNSDVLIDPTFFGFLKF